MTATTKPRLVLGSSSPRRRDLLAQIGITPDVVVGADIDETPQKGELPKPYAARMALEKNVALHDQYNNSFIVTADTIIAVGRRVIGKPADRAEAEKIIRLLSGRAHRIYSAVCVRAPDGRIATRVQTSRMVVKRLSDVEIQSYLDTKDWDGVSGAYRLQGHFARYFSSIQGSPSGIIGLPLYDVLQMLNGLGYNGY